MKQENKVRLSREGWIDCLLCAGAVLLITLLFATGLLNKPKIWPDVQMEHRQEDASYRLDQGDEYGVVAVGPYYDLDRGTYRLRWQINGDGANVIRFGNSTGGVITPIEVHTQPNEWQGEVYFEIEEPVHNFYISIEFVEGTWMEIYNLRLYTPEYTDGAWAASAVLLAVLVLYLMYRHGELNEQRVETLWVLGLAVLVVSIPALGQDALYGTDIPFHTARLMNLADGLANGQFPVRIGGFSYNGYGAVTSVFYPDLLLYPFAGMLLGGASLTFVMNAIRVTTYVMMAFVSYVSTKRMLNSHNMALCSTVLLLCSPFLVKGMYYDFMIGQMQAIAFMPLLILGLWEVIWGDQKRWLVLVFAATMVIQSHRLSTVLCVLLACVLGAVNLPGILRGRRFVSIIKAITLTLLMNLFSFIPLVMTYLNGVNTKPIGFEKFANTALSLEAILAPDRWIGLPLMMGIAGFWICSEKKNEAWKRINVFCLIGGLTVLLSTSLVPWGHIVVMTRELVTVIQFPWRLLVIGIPLMCICAGYGYVSVFGEKRMCAVMLTLVIASLTIWPYVDELMKERGWIEFGTTANRILEQTEYQIEGTDINDVRDINPHLYGDIQLTSYEKNSTEITAEVTSTEGGAIEFPLFAFDGYKVELDGQEIAITRGQNNRIHVDIPSGTSGQLHIWFAGKLLWRIADAVSLLTAVGLAVGWGKRKMRERRYEAGE